MDINKYLNEDKQIDLMANNAVSDKSKKHAINLMKSVGYEIEKTYAAVLYILEQVNAHSVVSDVERIFYKDLK